jgi:hypothetical protein
MGQEASQSHTFDCRSCHEPITVRMDIDREKIQTEIHCVENCAPADEVEGAEIVNVDANFLIAPEDQGKDQVFPRLEQLEKMFKAAEKAGSLVAVDKIPERLRQTRPYRQPDYADEWNSLKKARSLHKNGKTDLSEAIVKKASGKFYAGDPLLNLVDWVWRFAMFVCQPNYEQPFREALSKIQPLFDQEPFKKFLATYEKGLGKRADQYRSIIDEFFNAYSEFSQAYFFVAKGLPLPEGHQASYANFDAVKMFYGNAYEKFGDLIDYLAFSNNMLQGRNFDQFEKLSLDEYRRLHKTSRFKTFAATKELSALCVEADNQIRNASHHGVFSFSPKDQRISYRARKGEEGEEKHITYVAYLESCVRIFLQIMTLLRLETMVSHLTKTRPPI